MNAWGKKEWNEAEISADSCVRENRWQRFRRAKAFLLPTAQCSVSCYLPPPRTVDELL